MNTVIFDIDRTLADTSGLDDLWTPAYADNEYRAFHVAAMTAPVIASTRAHYDRARADGLATIAVTARSETHRDVTEAWLGANGLTMEAVFMRPVGPRPSDVATKTAMLTGIHAAGFAPVLAFDDQQAICAMWRAHGIDAHWVDEVAFAA